MSRALRSADRCSCGGSLVCGLCVRSLGLMSFVFAVITIAIYYGRR